MVAVNIGVAVTSGVGVSVGGTVDVTLGKWATVIVGLAAGPAQAVERSKIKGVSWL
jgi:hypothetical protein